VIEMNKAYAWFRVVRPPIVFIGVFGAIACALIFEKELTWNFWVTMAAWGVLWGGIMVHNDYTDLKSDAVNRPNKAVPSGAITPFQAHWGGMAMMVLPLPVIFMVNYPLGMEYAISATFWAFTLFLVGVLYNYWGKNWHVVGHFLVAWGVAIIPFYGAAVVEPMKGAIATAPLFLGVIIGEIGREIIVCAGDYHGDVAAGWKTVPTVLGRKRSMQIVPFFFLGYLLILLPAIWYSDKFTDIYLLASIIFIIGVYCMWGLIYRVMGTTKEEEKVWGAFELYARTGTRLFIIFHEFMLLAEAYLDLNVLHFF